MRLSQCLLEVTLVNQISYLNLVQIIALFLILSLAKNIRKQVLLLKVFWEKDSWAEERLDA